MRARGYVLGLPLSLSWNVVLHMHAKHSFADHQLRILAGLPTSDLVLSPHHS